MIPKIIHFYWSGSEPFPAWGKINIKRFQELNPEHEIMIHNASCILEEYAETAARIKAANHVFGGKSATPIHLSDLGRLSALERFGGWYFDIDIYPFRPLADVERAYCLDGDKLFCARQSKVKGQTINRGGEDVPLEMNGAVLAIGDSRRSREIIQELRWIVCATTSKDWLAYGPASVTNLCYQHPDKVEIAGLPWVYGIDSTSAAAIYRQAIHGNLNPARFHCTDGQLPFFMHLWAHCWDYRIDLTPPPSLLVALCGSCFSVDTAPDSVVGKAAAGIEQAVKDRGGQILRCLDLKSSGENPSHVVVWNHKEPMAASSMEHARKIGAKTCVLELGFIDRAEHVQIDASGFSHTASWASRISSSPPIGAARKANRLLPNRQESRVRRGYVLVLGQLNGDRQLDESRVPGMPALERLVKRAMPPGSVVFFRPHPMDSSAPHPMHESLPRLASPSSDYGRTYKGAGLSEALAGAAFVVTINSTAINEALAAGVPVLAFGPHLSIMAGAAKQADPETISADLAEMLDGWTPDHRAVDNYLSWIAEKQVPLSEVGARVLDMMEGEK